MYEAKFIRRYKRFFVDVDTGEEVFAVHNPNTGSMKNLQIEGSPVLYTVSENKKRKLPCTLEAINISGDWVLVNTHLANRIVEASINDGEISELGDVLKVRREFTYKEGRIDFLVENERGKALVEVKNSTYFDDDACMFPDAVTTRGKKHLEVLMKAVDEGYEAYILYTCQADRPYFRCASDIDPDYCRTFEKALDHGVKALCYRTDFDKEKRSVRLLPLDKGLLRAGV